MQKRFALQVTGIVQGVGFRPYVYGLALSCGLAGFVKNDAAGVEIEIEGAEPACRRFMEQLPLDAPPLAQIDAIRSRELPPQGEAEFRILHSTTGERRTLIAPDIATCDKCLAELRDPADRRYRHPFINCTDCGPRFTIVRDLPYDRPHTTMADFPLCAECAAEYADPADRRFHAQPVACPHCGPQLRLQQGDTQLVGEDALAQAQALLKRGGIIAAKGLGGYHLVCDAVNEQAVAELRRRKIRYDKPFAVMLPDAAAAQHYCEVSSAEEQLLTSPRRPIVLLKKRPAAAELAPQIAPHNAYLGVMLPYTPLHHLLMQGFSALVMTSGNLSDEPIIYEDAEALSRLMQLADAVLYHDRAIFRRCDDSVTRISGGAEQPVRRSRGYAPQPLPLPGSPADLLAVGGDEKNAFCLLRGDQAILSQHIGDLIEDAAWQSLLAETTHFCRIFETEPKYLVIDKHPAYQGRRLAERFPQLPLIEVQHHHAHLASVAAEHRIAEPLLGLIFDGSGYGDDGALWGGEVLLGTPAACIRLAHLRYARLPGGEQAVHQPWRMAMSYLAETVGTEQLADIAPPGLLDANWQLLWQFSAAHAPLVGGMGRLFDAAAALILGRREVSYGGQAAIELEQALPPAAAARAEAAYPLPLVMEAGEMLLDWRPLFAALLQELPHTPQPLLAARFHNAVAKACVEVALWARERYDFAGVALSGGCWQNKYLLEYTTELLEEAGFSVYTNHLVPPNDGGIAYGQAAAAAAQLAAKL